MNGILNIILLTLAPFLELRASIPVGILLMDMHPLTVFLIAITFNILLGIMLYPFVAIIVNVLTKIDAFDKFYRSYVIKTQKKIHALVEKYGEFGLAVFIAIPLPGSGVYSGALAAYAMGLPYKKFLIAEIIGVVIAGIIVTIITMSGSELFRIFIKV